MITYQIDIEISRLFNKIRDDKKNHLLNRKRDSIKKDIYGINTDSGPDPFEISDVDTMINYLEN